MSSVEVPDATCREYPADLLSTEGIVVSSSVLSYPCGEGGVQHFGTVRVSADARTWNALPFTGASLDPAVGRGTTVHGALTIDGATLLVGESNHRATFWRR